VLWPIGPAVAELLSLGGTTRMKIAKHIILGVGIAACLFILIFPPLRSSTEFYTRPQSVKQELVAVQISRFSVWKPDLARLQDGVVVRTEIAPGELLRELGLVVVLLGAMFYWLPAFLERARQKVAADVIGTPNP